MNKINKFLLLSITSLLVPTILSSCSSKDSFFIANYESYISDTLLSGLESGDYSSNLLINNEDTDIAINNLNYRTYSTNEDLERNFSTNYDVAIPSTYLAAKLANRGELQPIDWQKFNLYKLDIYGVRTTDKITSAIDALSLFSAHAIKELQAYNLTEAFTRDQISEENQKAGLLNYCVPYFIQDVSLGYNSKNISLNNTNNDWSSIMNQLYENINDNKIKRIATVDDYSSLYPIGRLIETNNKTINPGNPISDSQQLTPYDGTLTTKEATKTFKEMFSQSDKKNSFLFNSDSNILLNDFASGNSQAIISYNGDLFYAMQGGDTYSSSMSQSNFATWLKSNIDNEELTLKTIKPSQTLSVMDCMVINKHRVQEKKHENEAYSVIKKIALEGSDKSLYTDDSKTEYSNDSISMTDNDDNYKYGPMINFDYINYTSPLLTLNAYVLNSNSTVINNNDSSLSNTLLNNGYITDTYDWLKDSSVLPNDLVFSDDLYKKYVDLLISVYNVSDEVNNNLLTRSLSDLVKDNMSWAWFNLKSTL